jgi:homoserine dehydrogenase
MKKIKVGLAGLGTVGKGVYDILQKDAALITSRTNTIIEIVAVANRSKKDFVDSKIKFYSNILDLASDENVDVVVEVMGGIELAKKLFEASIKNGKKFVTANKALLAEHGCEVAKLAEENNGHVGFEASTAGANPVIKNFRESFTASEITEFYAILNGTCNFILTKMFNDGSPYLETLKEAQSLGYAEADPTLDVKGIDSAHKLMILSTIASATKPDFTKLHIEGVDQVTIEDVKLADDLGYKIKLLAVFKKINDQIQRGVYPALVKKSEKIAQVDGPFNAVLANTTNASWNLAVGRGAGGLTTGSAVVADLIDIANGRTVPLFGVEFSKLSEAKLIDLSNRNGKYFIRVILDKANAQKGDLSKALFGDKIKITQASFIDNGEEIIAGFLTENQLESDITSTLSKLDSNLVKLAKFLRIEETNF